MTAATSPFWQRGRLALLPDRFQCSGLSQLARQEVVSRRADAALSGVCRIAARRGAGGASGSRIATPCPRARCSKRKGCAMRITSISSMPARCSNAISRTCARCARACWCRCEIVERRRARRGSGAQSLVSNTSLDDFRVGAAAGVPQDGAFLLTAAEAAALRVKAGDPVRVLHRPR